jgi:hypothetical protein
MCHSKLDPISRICSQSISEKDFADLLIAYAGFAPKKKIKMLKRVRREFCTKGEDGKTRSKGVCN